MENTRVQHGRAAAERKLCIEQKGEKEQHHRGAKGPQTRTKRASCTSMCLWSSNEEGTLIFPRVNSTG